MPEHISSSPISLISPSTTEAEGNIIAQKFMSVSTESQFEATNRLADTHIESAVSSRQNVGATNGTKNVEMLVQRSSNEIPTEIKERLMQNANDGGEIVQKQSLGGSETEVSSNTERNFQPQMTVVVRLPLLSGIEEYHRLPQNSLQADSKVQQFRNIIL